MRRYDDTHSEVARVPIQVFGSEFSIRRSVPCGRIGYCFAGNQVPCRPDALKQKETLEHVLPSLVSASGLAVSPESLLKYRLVKFGFGKQSL
jgi:hypothetical protein